MPNFSSLPHRWIWFWNRDDHRSRVTSLVGYRDGMWCGSSAKVCFCRGRRQAPVGSPLSHRGYYPPRTSLRVASVWGIESFLVDAHPFYGMEKRLLFHAIANAEEAAEVDHFVENGSPFFADHDLSMKIVILMDELHPNRRRATATRVSSWMGRP